MIVMQVHRQLWLIILLSGIREKELLSLLWKVWKRSIILTVSFQPENVPLYLTSSRTVLNAMMECMFTDNYDSSFCFRVFEERLTQKNCFLFCKKYGLFNSFKQSRNLYCPTSNLSWSAFGGGGGQDLSISYQKQSCFSHGEGSFKEPIHKQFYSKWVVKFQANSS